MTRGQLGVLVLFLAMFAGSCRDSDSATPTTSTTRRAETTSSTAQAPSLSPEQTAAFDAHKTFWGAYIEFGTETNRTFHRADFDDRLGRYATGQQYNDLLHYFSTHRPVGIFFRGPPVEHDPSPEIVISGTNATVRDCMLDPGEVYDADDGRVLDPADAKRELTISQLVQVEGAWKVADSEEEAGACVA